MVAGSGAEVVRIKAVDQQAVGRRLVAELVRSTAALQSRPQVGGRQASRARRARARD
jgi:hypothetical protein